MKINCAHDEIVSIAKLVPNPKNPNVHPKSQIERLAQIIDFQGQRSPIVVSNRSGFITKGHGRLAAITHLGWEGAAVDYQDYESEAQEWADIVADNAIALWAELDQKLISEENLKFPELNIELLGMEDFKIITPELLPPKDEVGGIPSIAKVVTEPGDVWRLGKHRLACGDSTSVTDIEKLFGPYNAEISFTSPPYADQRDYEGNKDLSVENLKKFISSAFGRVKFFCVNLGYSRKGGEVNCYWDEYIAEARACGLKMLSWNVWNKGECGSIGNQTAMFGICHEWIFVFGKSPKELNKTEKNKHGGEFHDHSSSRQADGKVKKQKTRFINSHTHMKTIYDCAPQKTVDGFDHPARFSVELPLGYIEAMTNKGDAVYEPFSGSGTTIIACEMSERICLAMDLEPKYCDIAIRRWENYTGQKAILDSSEKTYEEVKAERNK